MLWMVQHTLQPVVIWLVLQVCFLFWLVLRFSPLFFPQKNKKLIILNYFNFYPDFLPLHLSSYLPFFSSPHSPCPHLSYNTSTLLCWYCVVFSPCFFFCFLQTNNYFILPLLPPSLLLFLYSSRSPIHPPILSSFSPSVSHPLRTVQKVADILPYCRNLESGSQSTPIFAPFSVQRLTVRTRSLFTESFKKTMWWRGWSTNSWG